MQNKTIALLAAVLLGMAGCTTPCCEKSALHPESNFAQNNSASAEGKNNIQSKAATNWTMLIELPNTNPAEKEVTWYLDYDQKIHNQRNASSKQGRLLIQPFDKQTQQVQKTSSIINIHVNCYERNFTFGIIQVYDQAYAQGDLIEQEMSDSKKHYASPHSPIDTGIINFYCKD